MLCIADILVEHEALSLTKLISRSSLLDDHPSYVNGFLGSCSVSATAVKCPLLFIALTDSVEQPEDLAVLDIVMTSNYWYLFESDTWLPA